jgi:transposase-like protein
MGIVRFALRWRYTFYVLALLILFLGVTAFRPTDIFPEIDIPVVTVILQYTGLGIVTETGWGSEWRVGYGVAMILLCYRRHRFPPEIIQHAIWLYLRFTLSYRDVEELLAERELEISYETVRRWVLKFGPSIARRLRRHRPRPSDRWHLDEMVVRMAGKRMYLWRAVDHEGEVLDMLVQRRRDSRAALRLMRKLLKKQGFAPKLLVTDKLRSYASACRYQVKQPQREISWELTVPKHCNPYRRCNPYWYFKRKLDKAVRRPRPPRPRLWGLKRRLSDRECGTCGTRHAASARIKTPWNRWSGSAADAPVLAEAAQRRRLCRSRSPHEFLRPEVQHCEMTRGRHPGQLPSHQVKNVECVRRRFYPRCDLKGLGLQGWRPGALPLPTAKAKFVSGRV